VRLTTDQSGSVIQHYDFQPFGVEWPGDSTNESRLFAGKERDGTTNTHFDYFGTRYFQSLTGRFTSSDATEQVTLAAVRPQLWNRYAYSTNNPLKFIDSDGRWPTPVHNLIFQDALGFLSNSDLQIVQASAARVDWDQTAWGSYKHAMRAPWQSIRDASNKFQQFVADNVAQAQAAQADWEAAGLAGYNPDALEAFGRAAHAVTDSLSPSHEGFQIWGGFKEVFSLGFWRGHKPKEAEISDEDRQKNDEAVQNLFRLTFGADAVPEQTQ